MTTQVAPASEIRDAQLAELIDHVTAEMKAGRQPDLDALLAKYPQYGDELMGLLPAVQMMANLSRSAEAGLVDGDAPLGDLGDFRLIREVGRGGMGVVYEAEQISLNRKVALKVLPFAATMDPRHLQRFKNEALAAASLRHENIVHVYGVGCERGVHFYAMEFIDGQTLAQVIKNLTPRPPSRSGKGEEEPSPPAPLPQSRERGEQITPPQPLPEAERGQGFLPSPPASGGEGMGVRGNSCGAGVPPAIAAETAAPQSTTKRDRTHFRRLAEIIERTADALEHAHSMGIVHRDIKPGNLLLDAAGKVYISDFGLARMANPGREPGGELTMTGDLVGTLRYMSPEQALARHGLVDHRTDIYSLGATLYELLTLKPAVEGADKAEILKAIAWEEPTPLRKHDKSIQAELETITLKCLAKEPGERYATAGELAADLRRVVEDKPIRARRPTVIQRIARWSRRHPGVMVGTGLVAGLLLAGGWAWHRETTNAEKAAQAVVAEADELCDADRLPEALAVARRAADLLPRFGGDADLRRTIEERVADLLLLIRLEEVQQSGIFDHDTDTRLEWQRVGTLFRQAFHDYGVDLIGGDERDVTQLLQHRPFASRIAAAIIYQGWTASRNPAEKQRLIRLVEALDADPRRIASRIARTESHDREALKRLAAEAEADLPPPAALARLGSELKRVSCLPEAERLLRAGLQRYPANASLHHELGSTLYEIGPARHAESIGFLRTALALSPHLSSSWYNLGTALSDVGNHQEAAAALQQAIDLKPDYSGYYVNLGFALVGLGRHAEAEAAYRRAITLDPNDWSARANLGIVLFRDLKKPDEAAAEFRQAIALKPDLAEAHHGLGRALHALGQPTDAEEALRQANRLAVPPPTMTIAEALLQEGRYAEAEVAFRRIIERNPNHAVAHNQLGIALHSQRRHAEAEAVFRRAAELSPDNPQVHYNLGFQLDQLGRYQDALAAFRRGRELGRKQHPDWSGPKNQLGRLAEWMVDLDAKLPALLSGELQPAGPAEQITFAWVCQKHHMRTAAAARLYASAFTVGSSADGDLLADFGYFAAQAAALAGCGRGADAARLGDDERAKLRRQALDWLTANLATRTKLSRPMMVRQMMLNWQGDADLAGVRDAEALGKLPEAERAAWQKLWADVAELLKRTAQPMPAANALIKH